MMQIFSREQIRAWDEFTITHEPISSVVLMERAAKACYDWLMSNRFGDRHFTFFCAKGNNGGDGLALARMLSRDRIVKVFILEFGTKGTEEFQANLKRLHQTDAEIRFISTEETLVPIDKDHVVIDALLGSGLNRPVDGLTARMVEHMNHSGCEVISIDIPSGLYPDRSSKQNTVVHATHTLSFQCYKLAFLMAENEKYTGKVHLLEIGLHPAYPGITSSALHTIEKQFVHSLIKPRRKFSHKGDYGHVALIAGSKGMMGAAVLCARAILRSGAGKVTCHVTEATYNIMQITVPEAMCKIENGGDVVIDIDLADHYNAVAIGPGIGKHESNVSILTKIISSNKPVVIDADGLNTIAVNASLVAQIKPGTILTPHPGEFARLFGKSENDFENMHTALQKAAELKVYIILKGAYTFIAAPDGNGFFNTTGNPGMAKGGSGDVLTGIIAALLAQGYRPHDAAILGVYLHGLAGDLASIHFSQEAMIASDIIDHIGAAFISLAGTDILKD